MAFQRYSPPNLPSLSYQDRVAWNGLTAYLPQFEAQIESQFVTFNNLTERDEYFTEPEIGNACLVKFQNDPVTSFDVGPTIWVYGDYLTPSFNVVNMWFPFDMQWKQFPGTMTNTTIGDGDCLAYYRRDGAHCTCQFNLTWGASTSTSNAPQFDLPFPGLDPVFGFGNGGVMGNCFLRDSGGANTLGIALYGSANFDTALMQFLTHTAGPPARVFNATITSASPITWGAGDVWIVTDFNYDIDMENAVFSS